jgi:hypothetical protein
VLILDEVWALTAKSDATHKSAREKDSELKAVDQQLRDKLLELVNCL